MPHLITGKLSMFDSVFADLKMYSGINTQLYHFYVLLRRQMISIMLALIADPTEENRVYIPTIIQISILVLSSLLHLCYIITHKPFIYDEMNKLEIFNECFIYIFFTSYFLLIKMPLKLDNFEQLFEDEID